MYDFKRHDQKKINSQAKGLKHKYIAMIRVGGMVRTQLYRNYNQKSYSVSDFNKTMKPMYDPTIATTSPVYALILAMFQQNQGRGVREDVLLEVAEQLNQTFTPAQYNTAFQQTLKRSIFVPITPHNAGICTLGMPAPITYTFSPAMDRMNQNVPYVEYLLYLVGGFTSPDFNRYFILPAGGVCLSSSYADDDYSQQEQQGASTPPYLKRDKDDDNKDDDDDDDENGDEENADHGASDTGDEDFITTTTATINDDNDGDDDDDDDGNESATDG